MRGRLFLFSAGDMEAMLVALELDEAEPFSPFLLQHFGKSLRKNFVGRLSATETVCLEACISDVESGAMAVSGVGGGVSVDPLEAPYVVAGSEHGCDNHLIGAVTAGLEFFFEVASDAVEQVGGCMREIGH